MQVFIKDHSRNQKFIARGKLFKFSELPETAQDALIHYMSVDGAAWAVAENWEDWKWGEGKPSDLEGRLEVLADITKFRQRFIDRWGDVEFGYVEIPSEELFESINADEDFSHRWATVGNEDEYDIPTWPVILSPFPTETLQDGWHRFYRYLELKAVVPVIWYPD